MKNENNNSAKQKQKRLDPQPVCGPILICLVTIYIILFSLSLLYSIVQLWPASVASGNSASASSQVTFLLWTFSISDESRLILIVAMAGALGSLIHTLRSAYKYIGERKFVRSWLTFYIMLPFVGAALGLIFYFVIRGGFFSAQITVQQMNPFGFAALSGLVGMFSEQAVGKLKHVFGELLTQVPKGSEHYEEADSKKSKKDTGDAKS